MGLGSFAVVLLLTAGQVLWPPAPASATPDADPLATSRQLLQRGELQRAASALEGVLDSDLDGTARLDALHLLGRTRRALGDPAGAVEVLAEALTPGDDGPRSALGDYLHFELAQSLEALGKTDGAADHYDAVIADPLSPHRADAAMRKAAMLAAAGDGDAARTAYEEFLDRWPDEPRARQVELALARLDEASGELERAAGIYKAIVREAEQSEAGAAAGEALERLASAGVEAARTRTPAQRLDEARWLMSERRFDEARPLLEAHLDDARAAGDTDGRLEAMELLVRVYGETRQEARAVALMAELAAAGGRSRLPDAEAQARLYALAGDVPRAERTLLEERYRGHKSRAYWRALGDLRLELGRYAPAYEAFRKARRIRGEVDEDDVDARLAWCLIGMGKPERALRYFRRLAHRARRSRDRESARYWYARSLQLAGREDKALAAFDRLARDVPWEYYGILAQSRAREMRGTAPRVADALPAAEAAVIGTRAAGSPAPSELVTAPPSTILWTPPSLAPSYEAAPSPGSPGDVTRALATLAERYGDIAPEAVRAAELARLGLLEEARAELMVIDADLRAVRRFGSWALASRARTDLLDNRRHKKARGGASLRERGRKSRRDAVAFGRKRRAIRRALRVAQAALGDPFGMRRAALESGVVDRDDAPRQDSAWRHAYPLAYPELVSNFAGMRGVPPYFLYGIMTVESTFHPHAVSVASAYGLLQVIPRTGRRIAQALGYADFSPERLLEPEVSIYFGSWYLGALLDKYHGQELLAAAAYNAGPHRVDRWLRMNPDRPMDLFVEQIPFSQARNYARSVLEKVARYRRIYHGDEQLYVSNHLRADSLAEPNF